MGQASQELFDPDGPFRRVNRESVLVLTGPRALLMQLAHPLVAQGVADHSGFLEDAVGRLWRTLDSMLTIIFAPREEALARAARLVRLHERVTGSLREGAGRFPAGTAYRANDPALLRWVSATLIDSALVGYERWVGPLAPEERELFYREARRLEQLLAIPEATQPSCYRDFAAYVEATLSSDAIAITPTARRLADAVLHPPLRFLPRMLGDAASPLSLGLLPPGLRAAYGLRWDRKRELAFRAADRALRAAFPRLPQRLRAMPHARRAA